MNEQISVEKKKQEEYDEKIKTRADNFLLIRMAFQHLIEVLDNVGKPHTVARKKIPGSMLNLPLLKFDNVFQKYKPPPPIEENSKTLIFFKGTLKISLDSFNSRYLVKSR